MDGYSASALINNIQNLVGEIRATNEYLQQLIYINKNLEKIANNTEKDNIKEMQDCNFIGDFYGPIKKDLTLDDIICEQNKNKDGNIDRNIILD